MGMFDDLFSDEDFRIDDEEEESLELETHDEEEEKVEPEPCACGPDCASDCSCVDGTCTCDPDAGEACSDCGGGFPDPSADIDTDISDSYCDDCGNDPCHCPTGSDSYCDDCNYDPCDCSEEEEDHTVWDTGYKKPPVPKNVWKPKHWKA
jgi:hypothetical protein